MDVTFRFRWFLSTRRQYVFLRHLKTASIQTCSSRIHRLSTTFVQRPCCELGHVSSESRYRMSGLRLRVTVRRKRRQVGRTCVGVERTLRQTAEGKLYKTRPVTTTIIGLFRASVLSTAVQTRRRPLTITRSAKVWENFLQGIFRVAAVVTLPQRSGSQLRARQNACRLREALAVSKS